MKNESDNTEEISFMLEAYRACMDDSATQAEADDAFYGKFASVETFCEQFLEDMGVKIPWYLCINWERTWECNLRHDFMDHEINGVVYIFRRE